MGVRVAVAGASGYAGGELLRMHRRASRPGDPGPCRRGECRNAGHGGPSAPGGACRTGPSSPPTPARLCRGRPGVPRAAARGVGRRLAGAARGSPGRRPGRQISGWPTRRPGPAYYGGTARRAAGSTACPNCPAHARAISAPRAGSPRPAATPPPRSWLWRRCWPPGLADPQDIVIVAASGTSGAGRSLRTDLLASEVMGAVSAYKVGGTHRHTPEIEQALQRARAAGGRGRVVHADAGPDAARHPGHLHRAAARPGSAPRTLRDGHRGRLRR